jgi:hypothetical protein
MKTKTEGKGAYKVQNEGNRPLKCFCSAKNSKSANRSKSRTLLFYRLCVSRDKYASQFKE